MRRGDAQPCSKLERSLGNLDMRGRLRYVASDVSAQQPTIRVVTAVVAREGRYLITQRRPTAVLPLLWEFPGGKVEPGESDAEALQREFEGRLGARIVVGQMISYVSHPYDHYTIELYLYDCRLEGEQLTARAVSDFRWVRSDEFEQYPFTPADEASMSKLLGVE
jgi:8-oxo-dGTP diphosphatase